MFVKAEGPSGRAKTALARSVSDCFQVSSHRELKLIFQPIPKPTVNDLPLVADHSEIEKVWLFFL
jgi:hypothetical protein